eukprot:TRINITY_DN10554_c0_g1_i6.p2 TRINITY_DN10554_c0_g1~~TRINITY_DN10554_c0_g1_i6.p2  ORF type:complete len:188 (+),score=38.60 TRINITY_DN10554_c0_g1_i6:367-930(+)
MYKREANTHNSARKQMMSMKNSRMVKPKVLIAYSNTKALNKSSCSKLSKLPQKLRRKQSDPGTFKAKKPLTDEVEEIVTEASIVETKSNTQKVAISHYNFKTKFNKQFGIALKKPCIAIKGLTNPMEGTLSKKSSSLLSSWKNRQCKIEDSQFLIYKRQETGLLLGVVDFRRFPVTLSKFPSSLTFT